MRFRGINKPQFTQLIRSRAAIQTWESQTPKFSHCSPVSPFSVRQTGL